MPKNKSGIMGRKLFLQYPLLVFPGFIIFTVGLILPLLLSFRYSVTDWDGTSPERVPVGPRDCMGLFQDDNFRSVWQFTVKFTMGNTLTQNAAVLLFAVALDGGIHCKKIHRAAFFIPCLISAMIVGFVWLKMFSNVLPAMNDWLGTNSNSILFGNGKTVLWGLLVANNWQWIGYWMLIYLVGLQSVSSDLYEAVKTDEAGAVKRFFNVAIPMLAPTITVCVVDIATSFPKVYDSLMSSIKGGPGQASTPVIYQTYTTVINDRQYGYGSAMTVTLVAALLLVALIQVKGLKNKEVQA